MRQLLCLALFLATSLLLSAETPERVERYGVVEIQLLSDSSYSHPIYDVQVDAIFTAPDGTLRRMGGFWDGGRNYVVRFAPDKTGEWSWRTVCSDTSNHALQGQTGSFEVVPYTGDDPYRVKGWPRALPGKHYLEYENGEPYFYMGDTPWEMSWRSYSHETDVYFSDRRQKGFNAVQVVVMSHRQIQEFGVVNRNGDSSFIGWDQSMLNPEYFRYLDSLIRKANDSGLMVTLVPLWGDLAWIQEGSVGHRFPFHRKDGLSLARYVAARFGAYNVAWIVAGDATYNTPEQKEFWGDLAVLVDSTSGGNHLMTVHSSGWSASWHFFDNNTPWLDFHTYHSSHLADNDFQWHAPAEGYPLKPVKPLVNGEQVYEDIYNNFSPDSARIDRRYVRQAAWESFLSGAFVGVVYGANSIWQWHNGNYAFEAHAPRVDVLEAIHFPGSNDATMVKKIMSRYPWWELTPRPDLVVRKREGTYIPCAVTDTMAILYIWNNVGPAVVNLSSLGDTLRTRWVNPVTGEEEESYTYTGRMRDSIAVETPDTNDWLLVVWDDSTNYLIPQPPAPRSDISVDVAVGTAPRALVVKVASPESGRVKVELVDLLGRELGSIEAEIAEGENGIRLPVVEPGVYLVSVTCSSEGESLFTGTFKRAVP